MAYDGEIRKGDRYRCCVPGRKEVLILVLDADPSGELTLRNETQGNTEYIDTDWWIRKHAYLVSRDNPTD